MKLIPAIIQDEATKKVLMLGYMNSASLKKTRATKRVWFYSRSKKRLWMKGETSGNTLTVKSISMDCDQDTILITAIPKGPTCHTGARSCFAQANAKNAAQTEQTYLSPSKVFDDLFQVILQRKKNSPKNSYTGYLFKKGPSKISAKVIEEALEVVQAAASEGKVRVISESTDLLYHLLVLLASQDITLEDVAAEVIKRKPT